MPYFPQQPRSACSSKDTAQPTCLQVHFVLFSKDLFLAPVLSSASNCTFSAAQHIKLGIWFTWEKNALCSPIYSSAGSVSQRGPLDRHRNTSASLGTGLLWGQEQAAGGQGCVLRQISSFNQISRCLFLHQCLPSGKSRNKGQRKKSLAAAWSWIDLIKPTSITKGKEKEETYQLLTVILFFQENHLKRLGSWTPSNDHDLVNLWVFFFFTVALSDLINILRLVYLPFYITGCNRRGYTFVQSWSLCYYSHWSGTQWAHLFLWAEGQFLV